MNNKLVPPCSYQGGKQRLAKDIVDIILKDNTINNNTYFFDICCGSGAITLELIKRGFSPKNIIMIDNGCFGEFWESIANNTFDLLTFKNELNKLPSIENIKKYLFDLSKQPINSYLSIYHYLLMQSGSFGSKAIWKENNSKWCTSSFRNYWLPTKTSNRKSPVNPMMPMPDTLYKRVENIVMQLSGKINAIHSDIFNTLNIFNKYKDNNIIIYIDPPYKNTSGYKDNFDIYKLISNIKNDANIYVSEGYQMSNFHRSICLSKGRRKGGINGERKKKPNEEWLNILKARF